MRRSRRWIAVPFVLALACTSVQSSDLKTAGMSGHFLVSADGTGQSQVSGHLNVDNNITDFVDLSPGDTLVATAGTQSQPMSRSSVAGAISYETTFTGLDAEGTPYTIALNRANDTNAPSSTCVMPKPFAIMTPTSSATFSRAADDVIVTYSNAGTSDTMSWGVSGDCVKDLVSGTVSGDTGTFTIAKGTLVPDFDGGTSSTTCQAQVTLTRSRPGQIDSHYGYGGNIAAQQTRSVSFNSTP